MRGSHTITVGSAFQPVARPERNSLAVAILLALAVLAAHGWSLGDGLFLDDHWHQQRLREMGWSPSELFAATTIVPAEFIHTWWQDRSVRWEYSRPVAVALAKGVHELTGGSVVAHHAVSLVLHFLSVCMVFRLCFLLTENLRWSVVGGLLFAVYSHGVFAVAWLASQNIVLQTTLMLAALLCYLRASGLQVGPDRAMTDGRLDVPPLRRGALAATFVLWMLALFSRENAVVLPVVLLAFDLAYGGWRHARARLRIYFLVGVAAVVFSVWRTVAFDPIPDVYLRRPDGDGYLLWCLAKLMHYLCASVWHSPMTIGPTGRLAPFSEVPGDCLLMAAILLVMGTGYLLACGRVRGFWIWPMWLVLMVLPVVPLLATPHAGYINGVAFAVAVALGPGLGKRARPIWVGPTSRYVAGFFLIATCSYIPIYRGLWTGVVAAERYTTAAMTVDRPPPEVTDVFCINLPFVNIYQQVCLDEAWGPAADRRTHVLTYAPGLLRMEQPCVVEQLDERRFSVSLVGGRSYFSGLLGRFLVDAMRTSGRFRPGEVIAGERFDVTIAETDADGVRKLIFRFHEPLASERYHFFLTTPVNGASRVRFHQRGWTPESQEILATTPPSRHAVITAARQLRSGQAGAAETLFAAARANDPEARRAAREALQTVGRVVAGATGAALQAVLAADDPSLEQWERIRAWWQGEVDDRTLAEVWTHRDDFSALRDTRDALFGIRSVAKKVIRTDLYLTGPPFPGPR